MTRPRTAPRRARAPVSAGEKGYADVAVTGFNYDTTGSLVLLNTVAQGAGVSQRIGKKWRMQSLHIQGSISNNPAATNCLVKTALVYDRRPTGSLPAVTDIYDTVNARSFIKDDTKGRFLIVREWNDVVVGNATTDLGAPYAKPFNHKVSLGNKLVINKSAGTGAIGDIEQGCLYLVTLGNITAGTSASAGNFGFRLHFQDM